ncbi:MAG: 4-alpha-glucanotransferase [Desulfosarcinaceae bacterium]|nr:4-alpha-glucanotransferase [Desulfosarcinaceae bacterium]
MSTPATDGCALRFRIDCPTRWGQQVAVGGDCDELGRWRPEKARPMFCIGPGRWDLQLTLPRQAFTHGFHYKYLLLEGGDPIWEGGAVRVFAPLETGLVRAGIELRDDWHAPGDPQDLLNAHLFTQVLFPPDRDGSPGPPPSPPVGGDPGLRWVHFRIAASCVPAQHRLCLVGSSAHLGGWREDRALVMQRGPAPWWTLWVALPADRNEVAYKYGLWQVAAKRLVDWESGDNRRLSFEPQGEGFPTKIRTDEAFRSPRGHYRGAGVAVPLFSLRSREGLGVGEFPDLKLLVEWAVRTGLAMIQLLPINDTSMTGTWADAYPYRALSVFALHPIYLRIATMAERLPAGVSAALAAQGARLNARTAVDYEAVMALKRRLIRELYAHEKERLSTEAAFHEFCQRNSFWLRPYAAFCLLRDRFGSADWRTWPRPYQDAATQIETLTGAHTAQADAVGEVYWVQYHLHRQLSEAVAYAHRRGVALKGDIPIGVSPHSADTWQAPALFHLDRQAGAPPDDFSESGQNWSMPTYNWPRMASDGYRWWRARIRHMANYFAALRIDHILGFFRIWEIPADMVQGLMGRFNPALPLSEAHLAARGIPLQADSARFCRPFLRRPYLESRFGRHADAVIAACCREIAPHTYTLRRLADTQRKLQTLRLPASIRSAGQTAEAALRRELLRLRSEVLFLPDPELPGHYHPRIAMHRSDSYRALDPALQNRLWEVYLDFFYRRHERHWHRHALERLPAICEAAPLLICGEDLGMVPACVPAVMAQLGILSLKVQRMPARRGVRFDIPEHYPYASVCTTGTHDMASLREWWETLSDPDGRQAFYTEVLGAAGPAPVSATADLCTAVVRQHLAAPSMWAIFPLQDLLAMDDELRCPDPFAERINIPSDPDHHWRYRLHLHLESLLAADDFNARLRAMVHQAGRVGAGQPRAPSPTTSQSHAGP